MKSYYKKIIYLDYFEKKQKIKNAGFAQILQRGGGGRFLLHIKGLLETDTLKVPLYVLQGEEEILFDSMELKNGSTEYNIKISEKLLLEKGIDREATFGILVRITKERYIKGLWKIDAKEEKRIEKAEDMEETENLNQKKKEVIIASHIENDKWKQLQQIYKNIHPYGDERTYLSIEPKDFIILNHQFQNLVNNSFLLHGYYNYKYLVLGKIIKEEGKEQYYIGVPGVYHEREKAVAIMFGFESFECEKEPAETGTFGYYLKQVEI